jgi:hypothetical protein
MTEMTKSHEKVQYDLRPAKQAERRMLLDAFQLLSEVGFPIHRYQYTGMGSVHFVDFILFHKYLGIDKLLSVEADRDITKRIKFNKPFRCITTKMDLIGNLIPTLSMDRKHILWLDYDNVVTNDYLADLRLATSRLPHQSIVLITFDAEPPGPPEYGAKQWRQYFVEQAQDYLDEKTTPKDFAREKIPEVVRSIVSRAIQHGLRGRPEITFEPIFNFEYADGHRMVTLGGMLCTEDDASKLMASPVCRTIYYRPSLVGQPFSIGIPVLTRKERAYLDSYMPCADKWIPTAFELPPDTQESIRKYRDIYRFLPSYGELLV